MDADITLNPAEDDATVLAALTKGILLLAAGSLVVPGLAAHDQVDIPGELALGPAVHRYSR